MKKSEDLLPGGATATATRPTRRVALALTALLALMLAAATLYSSRNRGLSSSFRGAHWLEGYHATAHFHEEICPGVDGRGTSHSGFIGLKGDRDDAPRKSFYW
jgi:hypothetical protein